MARPETPRTSVATEASLMLASSSTFGIRLATAAFSATSWLLCRVKSRSSRIGLGGMKLPRSRPCWSSCAIQGLAPRNLFDVPGVQQEHSKAVLQRVEDGLPEGAD